MTPTEKFNIQSEVLSTETNKNPDMKYNKIPVLNKGLNPEVFPGSMSKVVNAINAAMDRSESARQYGADLFQKFNKLILDTSSSYGHNKFDEMIEKTGEETLIEAIVKLCDRLDSGDFKLTAEMISNVLGFTPIAEANYVVGIILDDEEETETQE